MTQLSTVRSNSTNTLNTENTMRTTKESNNHQISMDDERVLPAVYSMNLHETITVAEDILATRVPGGWIYEFQKPAVNVLEIVFVPFNNEFQK